MRREEVACVATGDVAGEERVLLFVVSPSCGVTQNEASVIASHLLVTDEELSQSSYYRHTQHDSTTTINNELAILAAYVNLGHYSPTDIFEHTGAVDNIIRYHLLWILCTAVFAMSVVNKVNDTVVNLFDLNNVSGWNQSLIEDNFTYAPESTVNSGIIKIFFAFPMMGLMVMIVGSAFLRHRRIQLQEESARIHNARIAARNECARLRNIMRLEMVESALY